MAYMCNCHICPVINSDGVLNTVKPVLSRYCVKRPGCKEVSHCNETGMVILTKTEHLFHLQNGCPHKTGLTVFDYCNQIKYPFVPFERVMVSIFPAASAILAKIILLGCWHKIPPSAGVFNTRKIIFASFHHILAPTCGIMPHMVFGMMAVAGFNQISSSVSIIMSQWMSGVIP